MSRNKAASRSSAGVKLSGNEMTEVIYVRGSRRVEGCCGRGSPSVLVCLPLGTRDTADGLQLTDSSELLKMETCINLMGGLGVCRAFFKVKVTSQPLAPSSLPLLPTAAPTPPVNLRPF